MKNNTENPIYHHDTLEFVTVATKYCALLEQCQDMNKKQFVSTLLKVLPLLYMKAQMLPEVETEGDFVPDGQVTEEDYNYVLDGVYSIMGKDDEYEELVYQVDMETEESQWKSVSEDLADIYQALRNFVAAYQQRVEPCMADALWKVRDDFEIYWGTVLVCTLKRLHTIHYALRTNNDEEDFE